jgi:thymidylate synthase (FAD)
MENQLSSPEQQHVSVASASSAVDVLEDGISSVELIRVSGSDLDIVNAARVSYGKESTEFVERDKKLLQYLMSHRHTSPFEHNQFSFRIKAPIFVARQWMRHRMNSYNEISYRYVEAPLEFYTPLHWRYQDATNRQCSAGEFQDESAKKAYAALLDQAAQTYKELLAAGIARELARGVLPLCTYTEFIFTCNLHSLLHFLDLRLAKGAQHEIRAYAEALYFHARNHFPATFEAWDQVRVQGYAKSHG